MLIFISLRSFTFFFSLLILTAALHNFIYILFCFTRYFLFACTFFYGDFGYNTRNEGHSLFFQKNTKNWNKEKSKTKIQQEKEKRSQNNLNARHFDRNSINPTVWRQRVKFSMQRMWLNVQVNRGARDYVTSANLSWSIHNSFHLFLYHASHFQHAGICAFHCIRLHLSISSSMGSDLPLNHEVVVWNWCACVRLSLCRTEGSNNEKIV